MFLRNCIQSILVGGLLTLVICSLKFPFPVQAKEAQRQLASRCDVELARSDRYNNFAELASHYIEGVDYRITVLNRQSKITIIAPHGTIETGTQEIARAISGEDLNLYIFEGLLQNGNSILHLTSEHFDEPRALKLMQESDYAVSIHGFNDLRPGGMGMEIGGSNLALKQAFVDQLKILKLPFENDSKIGKFPGVGPKNIVNRCKKGGLQLEMSFSLRESLLKDPTLLSRFVTAVRNAISVVETQDNHGKPLF